jgi:UDP-N-acetylmuramoyl-tripeptide--D-alanyl-D-alanine ligase
VKKGLEGTVSLPGRTEITTLSGGIHLINDTYNANPGSVAAAIETLGTLKSQGRGIVVIGDMLELGEQAQRAHKQIGIMVARAGMSALYATGEFASTVAGGAVGAGMAPGRVFTGTKEQIVEVLKDRLAPGDWVLVKGSHRMAMDQVVDKLRLDMGCDPKQQRKNR